MIRSLYLIKLNKSQWRYVMNKTQKLDQFTNVESADTGKYETLSLNLVNDNNFYLVKDVQKTVFKSTFFNVWYDDKESLDNFLKARLEEFKRYNEMKKKGLFKVLTQKEQKCLFSYDYSKLKNEKELLVTTEITTYVYSLYNEYNECLGSFYDVYDLKSYLFEHFYVNVLVK